MGKLENLLNALIKMGWKPWGKDVSKITIPPKEEFDEDRYLFVDVYFYSGFSRYYTQRELVSYESGLWQICTERELTKSKTTEHKINRYIKELITREEGDVIDADVLCSDLDPEYRLMESALIPEEELEQFLLDNIKAEWHLKYEIELD